MKIILITSILLFSLNCFGDETLYLGLQSHHYHHCSKCKNEQWNQTHNLIGYSKNNIFAAHMTNSWRRETFFIGYRAYRDVTPYMRPYFTVGLATGYTNTMGVDIGPLTTAGFIGVEIHTKNKRMGVNISTIPGQVVAIGLKFAM